MTMKNPMQALAPSASTKETMAIVEAPVPVPAPGEILVEMKVSAVNEMDVQVRAGGWAHYTRKFIARGPSVSGFEFAGIARSSGARLQAGDRVIGYVHVLNGPRTHAQYVCVDENDLQAIPATLGFNEAASLVVMGLTAIEILERLKPLSKGQSALIIGAAGGAGVYSLQLAKHQGARVTAVCSRQNADWVRNMGADEVRAYESQGNFSAHDQFDLVVDAPAKTTFAASARSLRRNGMYVTTNPLRDLTGFARAAFSSRSAGYLMMLNTTPAKLARLVELHQTGALRPAIDSVFPLSQADQAFDRFATRGKQGRVLLSM
jgi:NADPH:quinone reductase-like Zn-dependent oxidoreductase